MPRMPISMIVLIMVVHNYNRFRKAAGKGRGMGLGRSSVTGMGRGGADSSLHDRIQRSLVNSVSNPGWCQESRRPVQRSDSRSQE